MITVVTGPPCSGKTTWVSQHRQPGDLVIDFDQLCQGLGGTGHEQNPWLREITAAAWAAAIRRALAGHTGHRVWIIDARPAPARLADYERENTRIIRLAASRTELHRRADQAGRPDGYHQRIDAYLAEATASTPPASPRPLARTRR